MDQIVFAQSGQTRMTMSKQYDFLNRLTVISSLNAQPSTINSFAYAYNAANQRTAVTNADNAYWVYTYDSLGQVLSGKKYWSDGTPVAGQQFTYTFDDIGNRKTTAAGEDQSGANLRSATYTANTLNRYTQRTVPGYANIVGSANSSATVTVNNTPTVRKGEYFRGEVMVANASAPAWQALTNLAVLNNGANPDIVSNVTGNVFVPKTPEAFGYDADGNMTNDGRWVFTWDAENRLTKVESLATGPTASKRKVEWTYDGQGRRIRQTTYDGSSGSYVVTEDLKLVYDGWRCLAELNSSFSVLRSFVWGLDLSGTMGGAGGVGGLLVLNSAANGAHFAAYDGNGNVVGLVRASDGTVSANYEYDPFGQTLRTTGLMASENPLRFSTKRTDKTTGLVLYEFRPYSASVGRWLSRDPIGERGGVNLYGFVGNDALNHFDVDGRFTVSKCPLCGEWYQGFHKCKPPGLSTSGCANCPGMQQAIDLANKALSSGACRKWFEDHGHDYSSGLPKATVTCYGNEKLWCACGIAPAWTFPGMGIGFCKNQCDKYRATGIASLLVHELAHHYCTLWSGRESCAESAQDACASQLVE